ncbi:hypothetical protein HC928_22980 [bacterium]|nr:hypothetical protein [bacterium]
MNPASLAQKTPARQALTCPSHVERIRQSGQPWTTKDIAENREHMPYVIKELRDLLCFALRGPSFAVHQAFTDLPPPTNAAARSTGLHNRAICSTLFYQPESQTSPPDYLHRQVT